MANKIQCSECSFNFNSNNHDLCPNCKARPDRGEMIGTLKTQSQTMPAKRDNILLGLDPAQKLIIEAQNRTTQAVRSLAITFVAAPIIFIALAIGITLAISTGESSLIIFMAFFALVISIFTLLSAINALRSSTIPDYFN